MKKLISIILPLLAAVSLSAQEYTWSAGKMDSSRTGCSVPSRDNVSEALGKFNVAPSLDFTSETRLEMPQVTSTPSAIPVPHLQVDPSYNPFKKTSTPATHTPSKNWDVLYKEPANICENEFQYTFADKIQQNTPIFQWQNKYIILPSESGLMMVHQHRAHVAILYKELLHLLKKQQGMSQALLFPEILELAENDMLTLQAMQEDLQAIGFGLDQFSPNSYSVTAVPMQLGQNNPCETLLQVIHQVQDNGGTAAQQWQENMALALADKMAIPTGKTLSEMEMRDLLTRLMEQHPARFLNNGQTIITILSHEEIQKRF